MSMSLVLDSIRSLIRLVPDFPKAGVMFHDLSQVQASHFHKNALYGLAALPFKLDGTVIHKVAGFESRGLAPAEAISNILGAGYIPLRKPGKLPGEVFSVSYGTEYSKDILQLQKGVIQPGEHILLVDDLAATCGTAAAGIKLVEEAGGIVVGFVALVELTDLGGREKLAGYRFESVLKSLANGL